VERAVPVGVGDSLAGFRLVGTQAAFLELYGAQIGEGRMFDQAMEVVAGASAARRLPLGASIAPTHGLSESGGVHEESPFTVVGHLKPTGTVVDRLALTPLASYWLTHGGAPGADAEHDHEHADHDHSAHEHDHENADHGEHDHGEHSEHDHAEHDHDQAEHEHDHGVPQERRQATAMLVSVTSPIAVALLPDRIEAQHPELQAVSPARETTRLLALIDPAGDAVTILGGVVMGAAGLSVLAALAASVRQRRGEWAVLRLMGAGRGLILGQVSFEGLLVGLIGGLGGLILAEVAAFTLSLASAEARALGLGLAVPSPAQWGAAAAALGVGALAGLIPALIALARDPERDVMEA
jgi:putative ABC transport system permease protein